MATLIKFAIKNINLDHVYEELIVVIGDGLMPPYQV